MAIACLRTSSLIINPRKRNKSNKSIYNLFPWRAITNEHLLYYVYSLFIKISNSGLLGLESK